jgi:hypothetical protein
MADDDMFKTTRMALLRGAHPAYIAGQAVFLQRDVQTYAKGAQGKVVSITASRPGEHRYQLLIGEDKLWVFESDVRPTPPGDSPLSEGADGSLTITQRLQSMSLSQRMATLGIDETRRLGDLATTQRMHVLTPDQRLHELLKTNRALALERGADPSGAADGAAGAAGAADDAAGATDGGPAAAPPATGKPSGA